MNDVITHALDSDDGDVLVFLPELVKSTGCEMPFLRWLTTTSRFTDLLAQCLERNKTPRCAERINVEASFLLPILRKRHLRSTASTSSSIQELVRVPRFDSRTGMTRLMTIASSRSSAEQRSGRAGEPARSVLPLVEQS